MLLTLYKSYTIQLLLDVSGRTNPQTIGCKKCQTTRKKLNQRNSMGMHCVVPKSHMTQLYCQTMASTCSLPCRNVQIFLTRVRIEFYPRFTPA